MANNSEKIAPGLMPDTHVQHFMATHQRDGETVLHCHSGYTGRMMGSGKDKQQNGALVVTPQRVVFIRKGLLGERFETIPVERITSVEARSMMGSRTIVIHTSHDELAVTTFAAKDDFDRTRATIEQLRDAKQQPSVAAAPTIVAPAPADQLRSLKALLDDGLIDQAEFAAKRAEIIARL